MHAACGMPHLPIQNRGASRGAAARDSAARDSAAPPSRGAGLPTQTHVLREYAPAPPDSRAGERRPRAVLEAPGARLGSVPRLLSLYPTQPLSTVVYVWSLCAEHKPKEHAPACGCVKHVADKAPPSRSQRPQPLRGPPHPAACEGRSRSWAGAPSTWSQRPGRPRGATRRSASTSSTWHRTEHRHCVADKGKAPRDAAARPEARDGSGSAAHTLADGGTPRSPRHAAMSKQN